MFLTSCVVLLASTIGAACQDSYSGHLAARTIQGLSTGATESVLPLMLTELTFLHQRSKAFALYWTMQTCLSGALNIASSYIVASLGWKWYYGVFAIAVGVGLVFAIFGAFETRFARPATNIDGVVVLTDDYGVTHVIPSDEIDSHPGLRGQNLAGVPDNAPYEGPQPTYRDRLAFWGRAHPTPGKIMISAWVHMFKCLASPAILYAILTSSIALGRFP